MAFFPHNLFRRLSGCRAVLTHATVSRSSLTCVRARRAELPVVERNPLVLKASEFQHLFEEGPTEKAYASTAIHSLSQYQLGRVCQEWARKVLREKHSETEVLDPEAEECCDGRRRGCNNTSYDFLLGACRVEIKSARLAWNSADPCWRVEFPGVKIAYGKRAKTAFDDHYLVILSPSTVYLIRHDLVAGLSTRGYLTEISGHRIRVRGRIGIEYWEDALKESCVSCVSKMAAMWCICRLLANWISKRL